MKRFLSDLWLNLQVAWDMKWYIVGFLVFCLLIAGVVNAIVDTLNHPELIGEFFGRIIKGFNSTK